MLALLHKGAACARTPSCQRSTAAHGAAPPAGRCVGVAVVSSRPRQRIGKCELPDFFRQVRRRPDAAPRAACAPRAPRD